MLSKAEILKSMIGQGVLAGASNGGVWVRGHRGSTKKITDVGEDIFEVTAKNGTKEYFAIPLITHIKP